MIRRSPKNCFCRAVAVNDDDTPDVKNVVLLHNIRGGMAVRPFIIVFVVDSLMVTDMRPIPGRG